MFLLLLKSFLRSRIAVVGLSMLLLAGITSIYIGKQHIQKQKASIAKTEQYQQEHLQRNVQFFNKEMGLLLYYLRFGLVNQPHPLNALSIGQRDVNSSVQSVTIRNLENQKYDTDLFNPFNLLAGNLDFCFVLVYLFPLLIIAFTYNLLSEEKEGGTWKLVAAQSIHPLKILIYKMIVRSMVIFVALAILLASAIAILSLPPEGPLAAITGIAFCYLLSWFAICIWVVSLQKKSSMNAAGLLSTWLLLTVVLPGAVNSFISNRYPVPEALATAVEQREGYHEKWDMDKKVTMDKFYIHYPQFQKYPLPDKQFSWLWYYAMQQMGDDDAQQQAKEMQTKLWKREKTSEFIAYFIPSLHTQHQFNDIAQSGLSNHLQFLDSTTRFHEKMRLYFYPKIFEEAAVSDVDWKKFRVETFSETVMPNRALMLIPLVVFSLLFTVSGCMNFQKNKGMFAEST